MLITFITDFMINEFCVPPGDGSNSSAIRLPTSCFFIFLDSRKRRADRRLAALREINSGMLGAREVW